MQLRQKQRRGEQFLLAARDVSARRCSIQTDGQLGAMGANVRLLALEIARPRSLQRFGQTLVRAPPSAQLEFNIPIEQAPAGGADVRGKYLDIARPLPRDLITRFDQVGVPDLDFVWCGAGAQCGVALLECTLESAPVCYKQWFHVEHTPIDEAPPLQWTAINQTMDLGIDGLDRECNRQLRVAGHGSAVDPRAQGVARRLHAQGARAVAAERAADHA